MPVSNHLLGSWSLLKKVVVVLNDSRLFRLQVVLLVASVLMSRIDVIQLVFMRMMCYSVMTQAYSEKEFPSSPNRSRTYDLPITSSDALPLSYRRLMGAKAIKLGSWDKHPAYC